MARATHAEHNRHEGLTTPWASLHRFQRDKYRGKAFSAMVAMNPRPIPSAQVLVHQPELTHSVWTDFVHRCRSLDALRKKLRLAVRKGEYVGYRLLRIEEQYLGATWEKDNDTIRAKGRAK